LVLQTTIMLVFREEKTSEEEAKAWQFWHSRQHSIKQRIFDADTKNSMGLVGCQGQRCRAVFEHGLQQSERRQGIRSKKHILNSLVPMCFFLKGLPLHVQIDTHDLEFRVPSKGPVHRGYCQIKVFCDKV